MERYLIYKLGLAILVYAVYFPNSVIAEFDPNDLLVYQGVHGRPGVDFPNFSHIPKTTFSCKEVDTGYYADLETDCQVFHICNEGTKISFLCPNGTIFQQSDLICDWWFKVNCTSSPELYEASAEHIREDILKNKANRRVYQNEKRRVEKELEEKQAQATKKNNGKLPVIKSRYSDSRNSRYKQTSEETQVTQETAAFVKDSYFKNNIQNARKTYPNHRTTYSDLKDPKYFSKSSLDVSSTTSSSIKPEIVLTQKAPINNGKPFTATTVEGIYDVDGSGFQKGLKAKQSESSSSTSRQTKKQTTITVSTFKTNTPTVSTKTEFNSKKTTVSYNQQPSKTTETYTTVTPTVKSNYQEAHYVTKSRQPQQDITTESPIIKIALNNKASTLSDIAKGNIRDSRVFEVKPIPSNSEYVKKEANNNEKTDTDDSTDSPNSRSGKALYDNSQAYTEPAKPKPKPFELHTSSSSDIRGSINFITSNNKNRDNYKTTNLPKYKVSSPSPFASTSQTIVPTQSTYSSSYQQPTQPTVTNKVIPQSYEHVNNMISTLMEVTHERQDKDHQFDYSRPDLIIPPSVGPQTLHTLAVYFANALDGIAPAGDGTTDQIPTERSDGTEDISSLLSQSTVNKYNDLFKQNREEIENAMIAMLNNTETVSTSSEDLDTEHTKHALDTPNVRQLAKVFTEALSAYLDDPVGFKKDLEKVRPTDPPPTANDPDLSQDDELLNFSDADLPSTSNKDYFGPYTTASSAKPETATWGFIFALNNSNVEENSISSGPESLQQSHSQYYPSQVNNLLRTPKANSVFTTQTYNPTSTTNFNGYTEQRLTTSSFISLFNPKTTREKEITAERQYQTINDQDNNKVNPTLPSFQQNSYTDYTTLSPTKNFYNEISSTNNFYNTRTTPSKQTFNFNSYTNGITTPPTVSYSTQRSTEATSDYVYTTPTPNYEQTNSFNNVETTESSVAKLFNYFENRVTPPTSRNQYTQSSGSQPQINNYNTGPTSSSTNSITNSYNQFLNSKQTTETIPKQMNIDTFVERQKNLYSDINTLNNLASSVKYKVTNSYNQYTQRYTEATTNEVPTTVPTARSNGYGQYQQNINAYPTTLILDTNPTVTPSTHSYTIVHSQNTPQTTAQTSSQFYNNNNYNSNNNNNNGETKTTWLGVQPTQTTYGNLHSTTDIEEKFNSLVNKATSILSNYQETDVQTEANPTTPSEEKPSNINSRATAASLTGNTQGLPEDHWTSFPDVTKLWRTTLYINPASLNQNLNATEETIADTTSKLEAEPFDDTVVEPVQPYTEIEYDLKSLPKVELNSTQVHGVLIDFINSTKQGESHKLERILQKLNTTEDEFLDKMKEVEKNPLTRRLILLLISECRKDFGDYHRQPKQITQTETTTVNSLQSNNRNVAFVKLPLGSEDEDARALDLLNSLYSIASKYGKK